MTTSSASNFAQRLRTTLDQRGIENKQFATMLGVSENTVSSWTTGRYEPGHRSAERIAAALGMSMDDLHGVPTTPAAAPAPQPPAPTPAPADDEAERIVRQLAGLDLEQMIESLQRATPPLLDILTAAQKHVRGT